MKAAAQAGSGLVEVAVSLLLISVATLGLAGLQISAKAMGYQAIQRTEAASLAADLLARMRANRSALARYALTGVGAASGGELEDPVTDCGAAYCSAAQLSNWDTRAWARALNGRAGGGLVNPLGCVEISGRRVTVEIAWEGYRDLPDPAAGDGCGAGNYGAQDARRRLLRLTTYIGED